MENSKKVTGKKTGSDSKEKKTVKPATATTKDAKTKKAPGAAASKMKKA